MPASYEIRANQRLVRSRLWGVVSDEDLRAHAGLLRADPDFDPTYQQLVDLRDVSALRVSSDTIARVARESAFAPGVRRAVVAPTDYHFGMGRMFDLYSDAAGQTVAVFRDLDAAEAWLGL